jgi:3-phosphoshikimate 1-carboxyvinyltransferase
MGAEVMFTAEGYRIRKNKLRGITQDMISNPDLVPVLAVLALFAEGKTVLKNIQHLQYKESDRIRALVEEITAIGGKIIYQDGHLIIEPLSQEPIPRIIRTYQDHRLIMAFMLLCMAYPHVRLDDISAVNKSCPYFTEELQRLQS